MNIYVLLRAIFRGFKMAPKTLFYWLLIYGRKQLITNNLLSTNLFLNLFMFVNLSEFVLIEG